MTTLEASHAPSPLSPLVSVKELIVFTFVVYLMALSVINKKRRMIGRLINNESEGLWKEAVIASFDMPSHYSSAGTVENYKKPQDSWCPDRDSNVAPPECKSETVPLEPLSI
jgi:hypothetical protein